MEDALKIKENYNLINFTSADVIEEKDTAVKAVMLTNNKWYVGPINKKGQFILDCDCNYFLMAEITPDGKYIGKPERDVKGNKDTVVCENDQIRCKWYNLKDGRVVIATADENGDFPLVREHIVEILSPSF